MAQNIVEAHYEPLPEGKYSPLLSSVIEKCLSKNPKGRPNILKVGRLIAPLLLSHMQRQVANTAALSVSVRLYPWANDSFFLIIYVGIE